MLVGKPIRTAQSVGRHLYIDANARYSLDLRTGMVTGPLRSDAKIISHTLVSIP